MAVQKTFICGRQEHTISSPSNTIALSVPIPDLPKSIEIEGNKLLFKSSFHVSLVAINEIIRKHKVSDPGFRDSVLKDFCEFNNEKPVKFVKYINNFSYCERDDLKSLIQMCEISNLREFFEILNQKYGLSLEYPPTHVTLYSADGERGIFVTDTDDVKNLTKTVSNPF